MTSKEILALIGTYFHNLLAKMTRDVVRNDFIQILSEQIDSTWLLKKEQASIILEYIIVAKCFKFYNDNNFKTEELLRFTLENFVPINGYWEEHISNMDRRFSGLKYLSNHDKDELIQLLEQICDGGVKLTPFFKELDIYIGLAESSGMLYNEPRAPIPASMLPTSKRWPFFISLVPFKTKFRI